MQINNKINKILAACQSDPPACQANLYRLFHSGTLAGSGHLVVLPVDQGFEHGPDRSFAVNPASYDPEYHIKLAIDSGLSAYAAPIGMLEGVARSYAGMIPLILKINSNNSLSPQSQPPQQAVTATPLDALRLGCIGIGLTIYPGSAGFNSSLDSLSATIAQAKALGLLVFIWSYPRGDGVPAGMNSSLDVTCYAAHIAALLGAHVIKVKLPDNLIGMPENQRYYPDLSHYETASSRIARVKQAAFDGGKVLLFSGGTTKDIDTLYAEAAAIRDGGGNGSIIGRNSFQRPYAEAVTMLRRIIEIYNS